MLSNSGGTAGRSVWSPEEITSKAIRFPTFQVSPFGFAGQRADAFITDVVFGIVVVFYFWLFLM